MGVNRGKDFEAKLKEAILKHSNISFDRFPDPMAGFAGVRNICDFGLYLYPFQYYCECKAFGGNTLNFKGAITKDQWNGLAEKSKIPGVIAGIFAWFINHDITVFVPIQELIKLKAAGAKSLNIKDILEDKILYFNIPGPKKRVFFAYDILPFMKESASWAENYWEIRGTGGFNHGSK